MDMESETQELTLGECTVPHGGVGRMNIPDKVLAEADMLNGDDTLGAYRAIAVWARREALLEAGSAVARCGYVLETDRTAFPSRRAVDQWEALDAICGLS